MKYVIVERERKARPKTVGLPKYPILFPDHLIHADLVPQGYCAVSAGSFAFGPGGVRCFGQSETLGLVSDPKRDAELIDTWLHLGESMLMVASMDYEEAAPGRLSTASVK